MFLFNKFGQVAFLVAGIILMLSRPGFCQDADWRLVEGKAIVEKSLLVPGKSADEIYKEISRWLNKAYEEPEKILKARLENEYLRGAAYTVNCVEYTAHSKADLQYSFAFEIKNEVVVFKIFDAFIVYDFTEDDDWSYPVEDYVFIKNFEKRERRKKDSERILTSLTYFSNSMFQDVENFLIAHK